MKYHALPDLLDRDGAVKLMKVNRSKFSPFLQEVINYSTNLINRCQMSLKGIEGTPSSLIQLYYHSIQMADSIDELVSNGCVETASVLHRSLLEAVVSVDYMIDDDFVDRSAAWLVFSYIELRNYLESFDPESERGKEIKSKIKKDKILNTIKQSSSDPEKLQLSIETIDKQLYKPKFKNITNNFIGKNKLRHWYEINGGPKSFEQMCSRLKRSMEYERFYRNSSKIMHAQDSIRMFNKRNNIPEIVPIRSDDMNLSISYYVSTGNLLKFISIEIGNKLLSTEKIEYDFNEIFKRHEINLNTLKMWHNK